MNDLEGIDDPIALSYEDLKEAIEKDICRKPLNEHYVNLFDKTKMLQYKDEVWDILQKSYQKAGGMLGMESPEQLVDETDMWKLCRRNGKINAALCYSLKRGGRKTCYGGCDMTPAGKEDFYKIMKADMEQTGRKVWAEVSDAIEHIYVDKMNAPAIPAEVAQKILKDKKFDKIDNDGFHYWRNIGGESKRKLMIGVYDASKIASN